VLLGTGSDYKIHLVVACSAGAAPGRARAAVAFPSPSFAIFRVAAIASGCDVLEIPTDPEQDFALDPGVLEEAIAATRPNVCFFARPNNPTGTLWPSSLAADLARRHPDMVVVSDEAYAAFSGDSMLDRARAGDPPNLLVMQTLSKMGLAALRIGYLVGRPALLAEVDKVRPPYNVGSLHARAARWALTRHWALFEARCAQIRSERARVAGALGALDGVRVFPSQANLILFRIGRPGDRRAEVVWRSLCGAGVLIRCFDHEGAGPLSGCLRVTIGTPAENDRFLGAISRALAG
jgi:histidinol-phosphate aminotransferase